MFPYVLRCSSCFVRSADDIGHVSVNKYADAKPIILLLLKVVKFSQNIIAFSFQFPSRTLFIYELIKIDR